MYVVSELAPRILVELGTYYGVSYCAFCQAVESAGLPTECYAVDTWQGDRHSGTYGAKVLDDLRTHHDPLYSRFSQLLPMEFDAAAARFEAGSVDLLHIDGCHTYASARNDFEVWLPKLSPRGVVLLHDTQVREGDFGVWQLWAELAPNYPSFEFLHGFGLGVLAIGAESRDRLAPLFEASEIEKAMLVSAFRLLGGRLELVRELGAARRQFEQSQADIESLNASVARLQTKVANLAAREPNHPPGLLRSARRFASGWKAVLRRKLSPPKLRQP